MRLGRLGFCMCNGKLTDKHRERSSYIPQYRREQHAHNLLVCTIFTSATLHANMRRCLGFPASEPALRLS
ncbi:predicted protein [Plenodomus lingam JN3]|uniref:Predicted protein n=1 Tax=Leptosphaeria maculans (strain JN3 / isolate v23.1.3 / race Av1-4-5-6-7-8) TaxID=985895 RepID=E4ZPW2_LEPMJ|nr:predicted protein [Plenodomus lingam JN3]CBX93497.1 predicted protein [Plenodomus lingam JN3]